MSPALVPGALGPHLLEDPPADPLKEERGSGPGSGSELLRLEMALTALLRAEDLDVWIPGSQTTDQSAAAPSHLVVPLMITPILQISHPRFPE